MNTAMIYFAVAVIIAFALYYIFPLRYRWTVLLAVSLVFYALTSTYALVFVVVTAIGVYFGARAIHKRNMRLADALDRIKQMKETVAAAVQTADGGAAIAAVAVPDADALKKSAKRKNKAVIVTTVLFNIAALAFLKYYNFFGSSFCSLLALCGADVSFRALKLVLPMGISFYTLSAIGYLTDVHRKKYEYERNFFKVLLFLSFFGTVMEGPICRYDQTGPELIQGHKADYKGIMHGVQRVMWGFFKKLIIADRAYILVNTVASNASQYSGAACLLFMLLYTVQLYADFSGFMDITIGAAELFGIKLPENFRQPFFAKSAQEFWQRWHITLGTWLKEYVFYSVALSPAMTKMSKKLKKKRKNHFTKILPTGIALLCVWLANGIWHGPQWNYIVYGLYYFVIIFGGMLCEPLFDKMYAKTKVDKNHVALKVLRHIRTLLIIFVGETIFGANSMGDALHILGYLFVPYHGSVAALGLDWYEYIVLVLGIIAVFAVDMVKEKKICLRERIDTLVLPVRWLIYVSCFAVIVMFGAYGSAYTSVPFMYGNF